MDLATRFADGLDYGFELKNRGILVDLQQDGSLGRFGIPQQLGQALFQLGLRNRLTACSSSSSEAGSQRRWLSSWALARITKKMSRRNAMSPMAMEGTDASKLRLGIFILSSRPGSALPPVEWLRFPRPSRSGQCTRSISHKTHPYAT
jgi:hypothetical protein